MMGTTSSQESAKQNNVQDKTKRRPSTKLILQKLNNTSTVDNKPRVLTFPKQPTTRQEMEDILKKYPKHSLNVLLNQQTLNNLEKICGSEADVCEVFFMDVDTFCRVNKCDNLIRVLFPNIAAFNRKGLILEKTLTANNVPVSDCYYRPKINLFHYMLTTKLHYDLIIDSPVAMREWLAHFIGQDTDLALDILKNLIKDHAFFERIIINISFDKLVDKLLLSRQISNWQPAEVYELLLKALLSNKERLQEWLKVSSMSLDDDKYLKNYRLYQDNYSYFITHMQEVALAKSSKNPDKTALSEDVRQIKNLAQFFEWATLTSKEDKIALTPIFHRVLQDDAFFKRLFLDNSFEEFFSYTDNSRLWDEENHRDQVYSLLLQELFSNKVRFMQWIGKTPEKFAEFCACKNLSYNQRYDAEKHYKKWCEVESSVSYKM